MFITVGRYEKAVSGGGEREKGGLGHVLRTPLAAAYAFESGHLTTVILLSGAGEGEITVVSKEPRLARRRGLPCAR